MIINRDIQIFNTSLIISLLNQMLPASKSNECSKNIEIHTYKNGNNNIYNTIIEAIAIYCGGFAPLRSLQVLRFVDTYQRPVVSTLSSL